MLPMTIDDIKGNYDFMDIYSGIVARSVRTTVVTTSNLVHSSSLSFIFCGFDIVTNKHLSGLSGLLKSINSHISMFSINL